MHTEYNLNGLHNYKDIINDTIERHELQSIQLDVQMILTEGLNNAFLHGNAKDEAKGIYVNVDSYSEQEKNRLQIVITDCGAGFDLEAQKECMDEKSLLNENGRGLYLIQCFSDKIEVKNSSLYIYKTY